jgi:hypothetical protein
VRASLDAAHQLACDRCRLTACGACCAYVQLVVTDGHRVRRITTSSFDTSQVQGIWSFNRVVTLAGGLETGFTDGIGEIATFNGPTVRPTAALTLFFRGWLCAVLAILLAGRGCRARWAYLRHRRQQLSCATHNTSRCACAKLAVFHSPCRRAQARRLCSVRPASHSA